MAHDPETPVFRHFARGWIVVSHLHHQLQVGAAVSQHVGPESGADALASRVRGDQYLGPGNRHTRPKADHGEPQPFDPIPGHRTMGKPDHLARSDRTQLRLAEVGLPLTSEPDPPVKVFLVPRPDLHRSTAPVEKPWLRLWERSGRLTVHGSREGGQAPRCLLWTLLTVPPRSNGHCRPG